MLPKTKKVFQSGKIEMKKGFVAMVVLQFLIITGWYTFTSISTNNVLPDILPALDTEDANRRELRSVLLTDGKEQGIFTYLVYRPSINLNRATVLLHGCTQNAHNDDQIQVITGFIDYIRNEKYRQTIAHLLNDTNFPKDFVEIRQMEVLGVLQDNLQHPSIGRIHILVWDKETAEYIKSLPLKNSEKLILRVIGKDVGVKELLLYASECLANKVVALAHQDNKFGKGWDNTEYHRVLTGVNDTMYALTRHTPVESNCTWLRHSANCDDGASYIGSHDVFVFRAKKWTADLLNDLNTVSPNYSGMENLLLWLFNVKLKYRIMNPCKRLFVHHHHCVPMRGQNRPRVNGGGKSLTVGFTDKFS